MNSASNKFDEIKISEALSAICHDAAEFNGLDPEEMSRQDVTDLLYIGVSAWNLSFLKGDELTSQVEDLKAEYKQVMDNLTFDKSEKLLMDLIDLKGKQYPDVRRVIIGFEVFYENDDLRIRVESQDVSSL